MDNKQLELVIGGLLHDIGKVLYRFNDGRNHSTSGYEFLKEQGIENQDVLNQIRFHHAKALKGAVIEPNDLAYITYWADNVAAGADRKDKEDAEYDAKFDRFQPLESIFNVLNGNNQSYSYDMSYIYDSGEINYPTDGNGAYSEEMYGKIFENIKDGIKAIELTPEYVNSLLGVLEANLSFVPSSTNQGQIADISLFDHMKVTAAIGSVIYEYLVENGVTDYKSALFKDAAECYGKDTFLLFSMDISGIQSFIYNVAGDNVLKTLRSKSFYLEMLMEHIIDELLDRCGLSRANLIYSGGGHAYILLANTEKTKALIDSFGKELKYWFIEKFGVELYIAQGYAQCSSNDLMNKPDGSYKKVFQNVSHEVSSNKLHRYTTNDIRNLNGKETVQNERECKICGTVNRLNSNNLCDMCNSFVDMSTRILNESFIGVFNNASCKGGCELPFEKSMVLMSKSEAKEQISGNKDFVRMYSKNKMYTGFKLATRLWVGDYSMGNTFDELATDAKGIKRLGVLRADVDNLGSAFVSGFEGNGVNTYVSLSRSATFSRKLSMFFKLNVNFLMGNGEFSLENTELYRPCRQALIVYSGGDDMFIIGAWNEIIELAIDINNALKKYTQGTLTISAGIGLFPSKYPVAPMADQVGALEDFSKLMEGKDAITIFDQNHRYKWTEFENIVLGEKYSLISDYFSLNKERGNSLLYKFVNQIRNRDKKINLSRFAYLLGRLEPDKDAKEDTKELYKEFSKKMYMWMKDENDSKELLTAIYIYVYLHREREEYNGKTN